MKTEETMVPKSGPTAFDANRVYEIEVSRIFADDDFNCRGVIDPSTLIDLSRDIKHKGLTEPIIIQPWGDKPGKEFRIVAGYRRFKAHLINQATTIRCLIKENLSDLDARLLNLSENLHREDLNIKQEAHAIEHFFMAGWDEKEVADKVRKSRGWVQIRFMLLQLPEDIQDEAAAGMISQQQIRDTWGLPSVQQMYEYVKLIKDKVHKNKKRDPKISAVKAKNERRMRTKEEIEEMQDLVRTTLKKQTPATRALGWAAGYISDLEFHQSLKQWAVLDAKFYEIPEGLEMMNAPQNNKLLQQVGKEP